jgi:hypothetical protein
MVDATGNLWAVRVHPPFVDSAAGIVGTDRLVPVEIVTHVS